MRERSRSYLLAAALAVAAGAAVAYGNPAHPIERHVDHAVTDADRLADTLAVHATHPGRAERPRRA
jgi:hypothetical protein